jgi:predicted nuclease of predicted toxin-antitoxin system
MGLLDLTLGESIQLIKLRKKEVKKKKTDLTILSNFNLMKSKMKNSFYLKISKSRTKLKATISSPSSLLS